MKMTQTICAAIAAGFMLLCGAAAHAQNDRDVAGDKARKPGASAHEKAKPSGAAPAGSGGTSGEAVQARKGMADPAHRSGAPSGSEGTTAPGGGKVSEGAGAAARQQGSPAGTAGGM
jgi:hypothetical protein